MDPAKGDRLTLIGISALACILQDVLHEGMSTAVVSLLSIVVLGRGITWSR